MIKLEKTKVVGWEEAIRGMRNPMNSWERSDSLFLDYQYCDEDEDLRLAELCGDVVPIIKGSDHDLMMRLAAGGPVHAKYRRMITVYVDITAPLYWWKEFDTYKVGTVANSCSTMHKIHEKEFTLDDFSCENLAHELLEGAAIDDPIEEYYDCYPKEILNWVIRSLNKNREKFLETKDKKYWWQMIQLLPSSYNQKRTVMLNYEVLAGIYPMRKNHKLDEWVEFCKWIEELPYSEIIIGE